MVYARPAFTAIDENPVPTFVRHTSSGDFPRQPAGPIRSDEMPSRIGPRHCGQSAPQRPAPQRPARQELHRRTVMAVVLMGDAAFVESLPAAPGARVARGGSESLQATASRPRRRPTTGPRSP